MVSLIKLNYINQIMRLISNKKIILSNQRGFEINFIYIISHGGFFKKRD